MGRVLLAVSMMRHVLASVSVASYALLKRKNSITPGLLVLFRQNELRLPYGTTRSGSVPVLRGIRVIARTAWPERERRHAH